MALSGLGLFVFIAVHLLGNLSFFAGQDIEAGWIPEETRRSLCAAQCYVISGNLSNIKNAALGHGCREGFQIYWVHNSVCQIGPPSNDQTDGTAAARNLVHRNEHIAALGAQESEQPRDLGTVCESV